MTLTVPDALAFDTAPVRHPHRWGLRRGGIVNVWYYRDVEFSLGGGRMILRGTNGAGKSRALEMLLPFLLDADRQRMDATGSGKVTLDDLMRAGADDANNRLGYLWLELERDDTAGATAHLTLGAAVRYSASTRRSEVRYFTTPLRVGHDLHLLGPDRQPLNRDTLTDLVGAERLTASADEHREVVRAEVFGLRGEAGKERFANLLQLLHTLRAPDVGNRIDEGRLPKILSDALAPLDQSSIDAAGSQLDGLTETRSALDRLEAMVGQLQRFLDVYARYAVDLVRERAGAVIESGRERRTADAAVEAARSALVDLTGKRAAETAREAELEDEHTALERSLAALRSRDVYKQADDLAARDSAVASLAGAAEVAIRAAAAARAAEERDLATANGLVADLVTAGTAAEAARLTMTAACEPAAIDASGLPASIGVTVVRGATVTGTVRMSRDRDQVAVDRRTPDAARLEPDALGTVDSVAEGLATSARERGDLARRRREEAHRLDDVRREVDRADDDAGRVEAEAATLVLEADTAVTVADAAVLDLAESWQSHLTAAPQGLDGAEHPALAALRSGAEPDDAVLRDLDRSAAELVAPRRDELAARRRDLENAGREDQTTRSDLEQEADGLRRERDPVPADPPWLAADRAGPPLWRCVDFADGVSDADQAGLEAALLAAGLLTASLTADGTVLAPDGQVLLTATTPAPAGGLGRLLRPDPDGPADAALVAQVLASIGVGDDGTASAVDVDGRWRHGGLRGRHSVAAASHIGATARARARKRRLAEISDALAALARAETERTEHLADIAAQRTVLDGWERAAPTSRAVALTRARAADTAAAAEAGRERARDATRRAAEFRARWTGELAQHRDLCRHHGVPSAASDLDAVIAATDRVRLAGRDLRTATERLLAARERQLAHAARCDAAAAERAAAEEEADGHWRSWHVAQAEVEALHATLDAEIADLRDEIGRTDRARVQTEQQREKIRTSLPALHRDHSRAESAFETAEAAAARAASGERSSMQRLLGLSGLSGLITAAGAEPWSADHADVHALAAHLEATLRRHGGPAGVQAVVRAYEVFGREVSGQFEVDLTVDHDVYLFEVHGAGDQRTLAGAHAELARRLAESRTMLTEKERTVFTQFVLGRVADQLRVRIDEAQDLVGAMNDSLSRVRTSHGIGVTLHWRLADDAGDDVRRIKTLVARANAVRSVAENEELTELLRTRVEAQHAVDPSAGYAAHLGAALDYRSWHSIEVTITGPGDQTRRLSRRAKLSQGETRFVSYVALFAAADGYLSSLPESDLALRLVLLDDAFAKVDDPTVAELMGLLVRLDLDFVLTGHALWGCYPVVPSIDVYEVRRLEGGSAVTSHVHWDGRTRHLRPS